MKITTKLLALCIILLASSCKDDVPVGFNISKVVPLKFPVELEGIDDKKLPIPGLVNPAPYTIDETFQLTDITSEAGDALDSVIVQSLQYKIEGVESDEEFYMEEFSFVITRSEGDTIAQLDLFKNAAIQDIKITDFTFYDSDALVAALENAEIITVTTTIDFAEIPNPIDFKFTFYFDVLAKVRP